MNSSTFTWDWRQSTCSKVLLNYNKLVDTREVKDIRAVKVPEEKGS
jgi:hypothetical protein